MNKPTATSPLISADGSFGFKLFCPHYKAKQANYGNSILDESPAFKLPPPPPKNAFYMNYSHLLMYKGWLIMNYCA
jgi:hypothetical protein